MSLLNLPEIPEFIIYLVFFIDFFIFFVFFLYFIRTKIYPARTEELKRYPNISFVIPVYNESKTLARTIASVRRCKYPEEKIKIIIVDDGSTDDSFKIANSMTKKFSGIQVYTKENTGKASSLNYGLRKTRSELVAVLDADTLLNSDILEKAISKFDDEGIVAVTARFKPLTIKNFWERMQYIEYTLSAFKRYLMESVAALPVAPAFTIFRREFLLKHGYFDAGNLTEDFEMGLRIQHEGYGVGFVNDSYARTDVPDTFKKLFRQRIRWNYGTFYNYKKHKEMFFNPKYGDLGVFIFPVWVLGLFISSAVFLLFLYNSLILGVKYLHLLQAGWIPSFNADFNSMLFSFTQLPSLLFLVSFLLAIVSFLLLKFEVDDKIRFGNYTLMLLVYLWILGIFYMASFYYIIRGKKPEW